MKVPQWAIIALLLLLVLATGLSYVATRDSSRPANTAASSQTPLVDQSPLKTARQLAPLAVMPEEQRLAQEAARIADHEVDLDFAGALLEASEHTDDKDPKNEELHLRIQLAEATLTDERSRLDQLKAKVASAKPNEKEGLQEQMDLLEAQEALDEDELEDARGDLIRAGGNPEGTMQRLREEHEAGHTESAASPAASQGPGVDLQSSNLAGQAQAWLWLKSKREKLETARTDAKALGQRVLAEHNALESHVQGEESQKQVARQQASGLGKSAASGASSRQATADAVQSLKHFSNDQKQLSDFDKRVQDQQELGDVYGLWIDLVGGQQRAVLHNMLQSVLWILLILVLGYGASRAADGFLTGVEAEKKRLFSLRAVVRFALQAVVVLLIAFVILGTPSQTPTVLGLAGAGLTVALKDFIVGFFGWFVLMGRNGIRVGDWVEINGVVGEVIEIGLLRTVLMETGNWTDTGHPTGRKVAFVNSFAIEGHFFNFSTAGQWLWDELQVLIPVGQNPYPLVESIQKMVEDESKAGATLAEQEWKASTKNRLQALSVVPAIHLRPTAAGVEMQVRYITSAHERYAMRSRMYEKIVGLMHAEAKP
ncbi:MAG TPA: mechanosensitive ion channel domain-containing protein [Terriglobales bacterium]|nr:mechanosensitive ion channel domain-containing protein [Terriglobales bacterium]